MLRIQEALSMILRQTRKAGERRVKASGREEKRNERRKGEGNKKNAAIILGYNMLSQI